MCGIAGFLSKKNKLPECVGKMLSALDRRGPDDCGLWEDPDGLVALGHTRLSIIDLSPAGHQPMSYNDGRYWITFNGEIYNYKELKKELENNGVNFRTQTDTEVVIAAWSQWGANSLKRLRGMFAFGLWDKQERTLILVRDRLGIKPLLWTDTEDGVIFSSELKAMFASGLVSRILEPNSLFELLAIGSVCQPRTMIRGVYNLEPGTYMILNREGKRENVRYWDVADNVTKQTSELSRLSYDDGVKMVRKGLEEACSLHLIADVPVGSFLSGGVDSTAITALMARQTSKRIKSFSVGFESTADVLNELDAARISAKYIGCDHTEVIITGNDIKQSFDDFIQTIDQPTHDGANIYFVSRAASSEIKIAVSGLGGDEFFAGYPHFSSLYSASHKVPLWLNDLFTKIHKFRPNRFTYPATLRHLSVTQRYAQLRRTLSDTDIKEALSVCLKDKFNSGFLETHLKPLVNESFETIRQISLVESRNYLLNTLLRDSDVISMRYSLEMRPVMMDHIFVELALSLPREFKIRNGRNKAVLKDAVKDILPTGHLSRPKTGFELPLGYWIRTELRERLFSILESPSANSLFNKSFLQDCKQKVDNPDAGNFLWTLLVLLSWVEEYKIAVPVFKT